MNRDTRTPQKRRGEGREGEEKKQTDRQTTGTRGPSGSSVVQVTVCSPRPCWTPANYASRGPPAARHPPPPFVAAARSGTEGGRER